MQGERPNKMNKRREGVGMGAASGPLDKGLPAKAVTQIKDETLLRAQVIVTGSHTLARSPETCGCGFPEAVAEAVAPVAVIGFLGANC